MQDQNSNHETSTRRTLPADERAEITILLIVIVFVGLALCIANKRYHIRPEQLIEGSLYLGCLFAVLWLVLRRFWSYQAKLEKTWPRVPAYIAPHKDGLY